ncbi:Clp protease N-terminal domain-containing protein [Streptacidiphilus jiangxiensis]|uniref:Clp protease N-terminal domain-containing protein n=1 Tax=Streptacidiphilus jiangxiensis TaxID=235985 RepID=UPI003F6EE2FA
MPFTPDAKKALELSLREALAAKSREILPEHLLLGLISGDVPAARLLADHGFDLATLRARLLA